MREEYDNDDTLDAIPLVERQRSFFGTSPRPVEIEFGAMSHCGKVRPENQDHYSVTRRRRSREILMSNLPQQVLEDISEDAYVMAVADGMGGEAFGRLASSLALRTGMELAATEVKWCFKVDEQECDELLEKMNVFLQMMDKSLFERAQVQPEAYGMGTTLTAAYTVGPEVFIGHVGDSRAYLFRSGSLQQLTRDHTQAEEFVDAGIIDRESVEFRRNKHILTNCLGGAQEGVHVETRHFRLRDGDTLLLCTDGLTDMVEASEIVQALLTHQRAQETAESLVQKALDAGGRDNVTVVIANYRIPGTAS